jgi:hypothetical protein
MRVLRRLAIWGSAATFALILVAIASYSQAGSRRPVATTGSTPTTSKGDALSAQLATRLPEIEAENRRLVDAVRALASERDKLEARIGTLERGLVDLTGSVKRDPPAAPASAASASPPAETSEPTRAPAVAEAPPINLERIAALPPAAHPPAAQAQEGAAEPPPPTEFGVDVGGATNFDGLRVLWTSLKNANSALFEGLHPQIVVRENNRTKSPELRLVVGPIANIESASHVCTTLSAGRRYCQPVAFEGQRLAEAEVVPERKAEPRPEPKPERSSKSAAKQKPAPTSTTPSVLRLFR